MKDNSNDYVTRVFDDPAQIDAAAWDALLAAQGHCTPFMRHAWLAALHASGSASPATGWTPRFVTLWRGATLAAAAPLYLKDHSYGEYVFDWAWANAYEQHGLAYYPKGLVAVPFTPVPGPRLMAVDDAARVALLAAVRATCEAEGCSSLHILFETEADRATTTAAGLLARQTVQFHWHNRHPTEGRPFADFDDFLASLSQDKRKKIRQERRKVAEAGVTVQATPGAQLTDADWDLFYRCYARTYREHGNPPYLTREAFRAAATALPEHWLLFTAHQGEKPIATSLIALGQDGAPTAGRFDPKTAGEAGVAWGRYWGALERVDCLHFELCYYAPLAWCIAQGYGRFEGGAQGEHKMARALMPQPTHSAHWLAHPAFADAVERYLQREDQGVAAYLDHLRARSPFRET